MFELGSLISVPHNLQRMQQTKWYHEPSCKGGPRALMGAETRHSHATEFQGIATKADSQQSGSMASGSIMSVHTYQLSRIHARVTGTSAT